MGPRRVEGYGPYGLLLRPWRVGGLLVSMFKQDDLETLGYITLHHADHIVFRSTSGRLDGWGGLVRGEVPV